MTRYLRVPLTAHRYSAGALAALVFGAGTAIGAGLYVGADGYYVSATAPKQAGPSLTASASIDYLDDQGRTMATPKGHLATQQILQQMSAPGAAASPAFLRALRSSGGVDVEASTVKLVLQSNTSQGITVIDIEPVALHRTAPLSGALYLMPPDASASVIPMMFDLNEFSPVARQITESASPAPGDPEQHLIFTGTIQPGNPYFATETIRLTGNESTVVNIRMQVTGFYATFDLAIRYIENANIGIVHTLVVSDSGRPFGVTGVSIGKSGETAAYQQAFQLQGNFSLCQVADPSRIPLRIIAPLRCASLASIHRPIPIGRFWPDPRTRSFPGGIRAWVSCRSPLVRLVLTAHDAHGQSVVIEAQFGPADHGHLDQLVTYATALRAGIAVWAVAAEEPPFRAEHLDALADLSQAYAGRRQFAAVTVTLESDPGLKLADLAGD